VLIVFPCVQMSLHLFEARYELHKAACNYAMDLNLLQAKRVPDFIQRVVSTGHCY